MVAFFGFGYGLFDVQISENIPSLSNYLAEIGVSMTGVQVFLGLGILFCQFAIIIFSMLDRIGDTIKAVIKPLVRLVPLFIFLGSIWKTYVPVVINLLPDSIAGFLGVTKVEGYMAQAVDDGTFSLGVVLTLGAMLLFVVTTYALGRQDNARLKALEAENARLRKQLRSNF